MPIGRRYQSKWERELFFPAFSFLQPSQIHISPNLFDRSLVYKYGMKYVFTSRYPVSFAWNSFQVANNTVF